MIPSVRTDRRGGGFSPAFFVISYKFLFSGVIFGGNLFGFVLIYYLGLYK